MAQKPKAAKIDRQQAQNFKDGHADTVVGSVHPDSAQHMGRHVTDVGRQATSGRCAGARGTMQCMK